MHGHPLTLIQTRAQELIGRVRFRDLLHKHIFLLRQVAHVSLCVCGEGGEGVGVTCRRQFEVYATGNKLS